MIKILINKLGRIRNAEVVIKPFMVFTGDSGLGKSYTAFLIDYLYNVIASDRIKFFVRERMKSMNKDEQDKGFSFRFGELREWMHNDVSQYLGYLIGNDSFNCDVEYVFDFLTKRFLTFQWHSQTIISACPLARRMYFSLKSMMNGRTCIALPSMPVYVSNYFRGRT